MAIVYVCPHGCDGKNLVRKGYAVTCKCCGRLANRVQCVVRHGSYIPMVPMNTFGITYKPEQVCSFA